MSDNKYMTIKQIFADPDVINVVRPPKVVVTQDMEGNNIKTSVIVEVNELDVLIEELNRLKGHVNKAIRIGGVVEPELIRKVMDMSNNDVFKQGKALDTISLILRDMRSLLVIWMSMRGNRYMISTNINQSIMYTTFVDTDNMVHHISDYFSTNGIGNTKSLKIVFNRIHARLSTKWNEYLEVNSNKLFKSDQFLDAQAHHNINARLESMANCFLYRDNEMTLDNLRSHIACSAENKDADSVASNYSFNRLIQSSSNDKFIGPVARRDLTEMSSPFADVPLQRIIRMYFTALVRTKTKTESYYTGHIQDIQTISPLSIADFRKELEALKECVFAIDGIDFCLSDSGHNEYITDALCSNDSTTSSINSVKRLIELIGCLNQRSQITFLLDALYNTVQINNDGIEYSDKGNLLVENLCSIATRDKQSYIDTCSSIFGVKASNTFFQERTTRTFNKFKLCLEILNIIDCQESVFTTTGNAIENTIRIGVNVKKYFHQSIVDSCMYLIFNMRVNHFSEIAMDITHDNITTIGNIVSSPSVVTKQLVSLLNELVNVDNWCKTPVIMERCSAEHHKVIDQLIHWGNSGTIAIPFVLNTPRFTSIKNNFNQVSKTNMYESYKKILKFLLSKTDTHVSVSDKRSVCCALTSIAGAISSFASTHNTEISEMDSKFVEMLIRSSIKISSTSGENCSGFGIRPEIFSSSPCGRIICEKMSDIDFNNASFFVIPGDLADILLSSITSIADINSLSLIFPFIRFTESAKFSLIVERTMNVKHIPGV